MEEISHLIISHQIISFPATAQERYTASQTEKRILLDHNLFYSTILFEKYKYEIRRPCRNNYDK